MTPQGRGTRVAYAQEHRTSSLRNMYSLDAVRLQVASNLSVSVFCTFPFDVGDRISTGGETVLKAIVARTL